jgi:hypothetical protein
MKLEMTMAAVGVEGIKNVDFSPDFCNFVVRCKID